MRMIQSGKNFPRAGNSKKAPTLLRGALSDELNPYWIIAGFGARMKVRFELAVEVKSSV